MMHLIATFGGVGHIKPAPGTWGSLAAIPVAWLLFVIGGPWLLLFAVPLAAFAGWKATEAEIAGQEDHDPSHVVIDEVAGQWIALLPVAFGAQMMATGFWALYPGIIAAFLLFRLFDITKWGPIGTADRRGDAWGVMLDDLIAGVFAAVGVCVLAVLGHGLMRMI